MNSRPLSRRHSHSEQAVEGRIGESAFGRPKTAGAKVVSQRDNNVHTALKLIRKIDYTPPLPPKKHLSVGYFPLYLYSIF